MDEIDHDDMRQDARSQSPGEPYLPPSMPPPPSPLPGWLNHTPKIAPEHFPRSPAPFAYSATASITSPPPLTSTSYDQYLHNNHPAYAQPSSFQSTNRRAPALGTGPQSGFFSQDLSDHHPSSRPSSSTGSAEPNTLPFPASHQYLLPSHAQAANEPYGHSPWDLSLTTPRLPLAPQHVQSQHDHLQQLPEIDPALYHIDALRARSQGDTSTSLMLPDDDLQDSPMLDDDSTDEDETDIDDVPAANWPTRGHKRPVAESEGGKRGRGRPPKRLKPGERKRGRRKGEGLGPRAAIDPGEDFMKVYNQAVAAFLEEEDMIKAQTLVLQAIGLNPEVFAAHSLLADIHFANGDSDAGIDALMVGVHAHINDIELWRQVAETVLAEGDETHPKRVERAIYCYSAILRKNGKDLDARFQRAECARLMRAWNRASNDLLILLEDDPHNSAVLAQYTRVCLDVGDYQRPLDMYKEHFEFYRLNGLSDEQHFTWQDIGNYIDLLQRTGSTAEAIFQLKALTRWLCGRDDEQFWDEFIADDRELDQMHHPRRLEVPQFEPNRHQEQDYGEALPLDLRGKLGVMRLKLNFRTEAQSHFAWLEPDLEGEESLVDEYSDTFYEVAKALYDAGEHEQALHFYDALHSEGLVLGKDFLLDMGASCFVCGQEDRGIEMYERAISEYELDGSEGIVVRTQLTNLYKDRGDRKMALKYGNEAVLIAQDLIPVGANRKYERREQRLQREAAERALKAAYKLPKRPGQGPGKVPRGLQYRTRLKTYSKRWVPVYDTPPPESPEPSPHSSGEDLQLETPEDTPSKKKKKQKKTKKKALPDDADIEKEPPMYDKPIKVPKRVGRPPKPKPKFPPRKVLNQQNVFKHYEEMQELYQALLSHQEAMRDDDEEAINLWMDCAMTMFEDYRKVKVFFPNDRHKRFEGYTAAVPRPRPRTSTPDGIRSSQVSDGAMVNDALSMSRQSVVQPTDDLDEEASGARRLAPLSIPDEYCGIRFATWLDILLELALLHANSTSSDGQSQCYTIMGVCIDCTLFYHDAQSLHQIYSCWLACCLVLDDSLTLYNVVLRWFMREYAFCTDTYRLYSAVTLVNQLPSSSNAANDGTWKSGPNQKFVFRQIMSIDKLLPDDYNINGPEGGVPAFMRRHRDELRKLSVRVETDRVQGPSNENNEQRPRSPGTNDDQPEANLNMNKSPSRQTPSNLGTTIAPATATAVKYHSPTEMDVVLLTLYAHIMMASGSFPNALSYLYRAYSLDPTNTVVLLSMALCYMHELFKRQTGNRHSYALMGWAWFGAYERERRSWAKKLDVEAGGGSINNGDNEANGNRDIGYNSPANHPANLTSKPKPKSRKVLDTINREIEFNRARCWEMLGMADLAMKRYKNVLALAPALREPSAITTTRNNRNGEKLPVNGSDDRGKDKQDTRQVDHDDDDDDEEEEEEDEWTMEAAYAMSMLYVLSGNGARAREITEKYLVV